MEKQTVYTQYTATLKSLLEMPVKLQQSYKAAGQKATANAEALAREEQQALAGVQNLQSAAQREYAAIQQQLEDIRLSIPPRQRACTPPAGKTAAQLLEEQQKAAIAVQQGIRRLKEQEKAAGQEQSARAEALAKRRQLYLEQMQNQEKEAPPPAPPEPAKKGCAPVGLIALVGIILLLLL